MWPDKVHWVGRLWHRWVALQYHRLCLRKIYGIGTRSYQQKSLPSGLYSKHFSNRYESFSHVTKTILLPTARSSSDSNTCHTRLTLLASSYRIAGEPRQRETASVTRSTPLRYLLPPTQPTTSRDSDVTRKALLVAKDGTAIWPYIRFVPTAVLSRNSHMPDVNKPVWLEGAGKALSDEWSWNSKNIHGRVKWKPSVTR